MALTDRTYAQFGGENNYKFDHDIYWRTLVQECHLVSLDSRSSVCSCHADALHRQAPDGGRLDKDGKPTVAPLGNGAKAAALGLEAAGGMPEMQHVQAETRPGMSPAVVDESQRSSYMAGAVGGATVAGGAAIGSTAISDKPTTSRADDAQLNEKMENLRTSSIKQEAQTPRRSVDSVRSVQSVEVETAPGPPAGQVAFDHPPSEEEKLKARQLMEQEAAATTPRS